MYDRFTSLRLSIPTAAQSWWLFNINRWDFAENIVETEEIFWICCHSSSWFFPCLGTKFLSFAFELDNPEFIDHTRWCPPSYTWVIIPITSSI